MAVQWLKLMHRLVTHVSEIFSVARDLRHPASRRHSSDVQELSYVASHPILVEFTPQGYATARKKLADCMQLDDDNELLPPLVSLTEASASITSIASPPIYLTMFTPHARLR